jgi:CRP/FNR family transcriptional regulator, anaerobic regulatory protein
MTELFRHMERFINLSGADKNFLSSSLSCSEIKKKEFLLKEGKTCTTNYFIAKGCVRMYYVNDKGVEHIVQFGIDNWWITDYVSYQSQSPSQFYIQAVEATSIICWDKEKEEERYKKLPQLERYFRLILQRAVAAAQQRFKYLDDFTGEERYKHFASSFPDFIQRVPQYMLASYLGFTPEFLSKIRAGKS